MVADRTLVVVLCGGTSSERGISLESGGQVHAQLDRTRFEPLAAVIQADGSVVTGDSEELAPDALEGDSAGRSLVEEFLTWKKMGVQVVFIALHGSPGEDGTIQALARWADLPCTGSGVIESALCMDKIATRALLRDLGFPVARAAVVYREHFRAEPEATIERLLSPAGPRLPCFLKSPRGGSSLGLHRVSERAALHDALDDLFKLDDRVLAERGFSGVEISCGVLGNAGDPDLLALEPVEIRPRSEGFFSYLEKYSSDRGALELCPSETLSRDRIAEFQEHAKVIHRGFGLRGMSRVDFIVGDGEYVVLEINTIPGLSRRSLLPQGAQAVGIGFKELLTRIVEAALR